MGEAAAPRSRGTAVALLPGMNARADIDAFFASKRLAFVGVSRNPQDFSRQLLKELRLRGYDVVPVNPAADEIDDLPAAKAVRDVAPPADAVLVMTPPAASEAVVREAADAGVPLVWLHRGAGQGAVSDAAVEAGRARGLKMVVGECPFMFLPDTGFVHRVHGFFRKVGGHYPH